MSLLKLRDMIYCVCLYEVTIESIMEFQLLPLQAPTEIAGFLLVYGLLSITFCTYQSQIGYQVKGVKFSAQHIYPH